MKISALAQFIFPYQKILVGFSGGLDSTVLLHCLMLLRNQQSELRLRAVHVNHGLSLHAEEWATHCQSVCVKWDIPLSIERVILQHEGLGIEGQARKARYAAFANMLLPGEAIITAQHLDDQCETLLLALKRGSGPAGLSSMPARTAFAKTQQLRPFLNVSRALLETWAKEHNLCWIEDESNQDDSYDRNFLRLRIVPLLTERWPFFKEAAARSAQLCAEQENLLDELLSDELLKAISEEKAIAIVALQDKSTEHRGALLRRWLSIHKVIMPSRDMLTRIWREVALARKHANPILRLNRFEIRRYQGKLWCIPYFPKIIDRVLCWPNITKTLKLPHDMGYVSLQPNGQIRLPIKGEYVTIRFQVQGMLNIVGSCGNQKIEKIWQEYNVPPWRRESTPMLFYGEKLIAVAKLFITQEGFDESGMRFIWEDST